MAITNGAHRKVLKEVKSDIMRSHNKGGQSSVRFERLRDESVYTYIKYACQQANKIFRSVNLNDQIQGFIIAGSAKLKQDFMECELLDPIIKKNILKVIDVSHGSEEGLKMAIMQAQNQIVNSSHLKEKKVLIQFFQELEKNSMKVSNGLNCCIALVQMGIVEKLIYVKTKQSSTNEIGELEDLCKENGVSFVVVSDATEEANTMIRGYGGVGAILRYEFDASYLYDDEKMEAETGMKMETELDFIGE